MHHAFLYISLRWLHGYNVKVPNFVKDANTRQQLSLTFPLIQFFIDLSKSSRIHPPKHAFANILRIKRDGIRAIKFEAARIHFLSDVFVAVVVLVAYAP